MRQEEVDWSNPSVNGEMSECVLCAASNCNCEPRAALDKELEPRYRRRRTSHRHRDRIIAESPITGVEKQSTIEKSVKNSEKEKAYHTEKSSNSFSNMKFTYLSTFSNVAISRASSYFSDLGGYGVFVKSMFAGLSYYQANKLTETYLWKTKDKKETEDVDINGMTTTIVMIAQWCLLINLFPELSNVRYSYQCAALVGAGPLMHWVINDWVSHKVRKDRSSLGINIFDVSAANLLMTKLLGMLNILGIKSKDIGIEHTIIASLVAKNIIDQAGNTLVKFDKKVIDPIFSGLLEKSCLELKKSWQAESNRLWSSDKSRLEQIAYKSSQTYEKILGHLRKMGGVMKQDAVWLSKPILSVFSKTTKDDNMADRSLEKNNPVRSTEVTGLKKRAGHQRTVKHHDGNTCGCTGNHNMLTQ
ncbi:MAG: hypothetical protein VX737_03730 [Pseudomonadota bacterium]|nr:hypothetical protein [Pseudomonadota bacterium]